MCPQLTPRIPFLDRCWHNLYYLHGYFEASLNDYQPNPNPSLASWIASSSLSSKCCLEGYSGRSNWLKLHKSRVKNQNIYTNNNVSGNRVLTKIINLRKKIYTKYELKASDQDCHMLCVSETFVSLKFLEVHWNLLKAPGELERTVIRPLTN